MNNKYLIIKKFSILNRIFNFNFLLNKISILENL
jgi:hypothetical protein